MASGAAPPPRLGQEVSAVIVLDRPLPGMLDGGPIPVISADSLLEFLRRPEEEESRLPSELRRRLAEQREHPHQPGARGAQARGGKR